MFRFLNLLRLAVELVAAFVGIGIVVALLLVWRLSASPISSDFLTPYIEAAIENIIPGSEVHASATLLTWNGAEHAIMVHAEDLKIIDVRGTEIADVPSFDAKISILGLVFGQLMPKDLTIDHPQIKLERNKDGVFVFGGMAMGDGSNASGPEQETIQEVIRNISEHLSHAALMHKLAVTRAVFDIHDDLTQKDWAVSMPEISVSRYAISEMDHKITYGVLDGRLTVEVTQEKSVASVNVHYIYDPTKEHHNLSAIFSDLTPAFMAGGHPETLGLGAASIIDLPLTGGIELTLDKDLSVESIATQIHGDAGHLVYPTFWDDPCPVKSFDLNADYDRDAHKLTVSDTNIDFDGPVLSLAIEGTPPLQNGRDLDFTAQIKADNMPMNRYGELAPKPVLPDPRYWLVSNLRDGIFSHAEATLKGGLAWGDLANIAIDEGGGKMSASGATVTYLDGMPPAEGVSADAVFDLKKMDVTITGGGLGNIKISPFTMHITGLSDPDQNIDIPLQVAGPIPDILRLLDHEPLGYAKALGISPDDLTGQISGLVQFQFPLLKTLDMKDVSIRATAKAMKVASTKLIPGVAIDQGNLGLTLDTSGFQLDGNTNLDEVPFQVTWQENFEEKPGEALRRATIVGTVSDDQWKSLGIGAFDGTKGPVNVNIEMTEPNKNQMNFTGVLDMTQAAIEVDRLDWKKPANVPAVLKFTADAPKDKPVSVTSIDLRGDKVSAAGTAALSSDMTQLLSLNLSPLIIGRTNIGLHLTQTYGDHGSLTFEATGAGLDVSGLRGNNDPSLADPRPKHYRIKVNKLYTSETGFISNAQGTALRDSEGWSEIDLHGMAGGDTPLSMELTPQPDGHRIFSVSSDNFGKAMKGLGFTDTIKGGKLSISGQSSVENPRLVTGKIKVSDFSVEKLPALALLLNATSPFGFSGILTDSADFSRFSGEFNWQDDTISLTSAHAAGSAIGINIDGKIDMNSGNANLQGTLVPFSVMNNILNYIPIIGNLLTGGENQGVLAVSYQIKGPLNAPKVSVNPVSLLTPGFLRNLFFRDDTGDDNP